MPKPSNLPLLWPTEWKKPAPFMGACWKNHQDPNNRCRQPLTSNVKNPIVIANPSFAAKHQCCGYKSRSRQQNVEHTGQQGQRVMNEVAWTVSSGHWTLDRQTRVKALNKGFILHIWQKDENALVSKINVGSSASRLPSSWNETFLLILHNSNRFACHLLTPSLIQCVVPSSGPWSSCCTTILLHIFGRNFRQVFYPGLGPWE